MDGERSSPIAAEVDVMNDPIYEVNAKDKQKNVDDPDTCRICRGEGSKEEPLFYPCKCSGSIKFVHQSCLMEWLSHSQKKHCELCKTPFRFTKLYHPQMPNSVPLPVFLRQAALHTWRSFLAWSRMHLVLFVWVAWLPWSMRAVWRGLFWVGDGGWVRNQVVQNVTSSVAQASGSTSGTSPASQTSLLSKDDVAAAVVSQMAKALPQVSSPVAQTLDYTTSRSTLFRLAKHLIWSDFARGSGQDSFIDLAPDIDKVTSSATLNSGRNSWLADVRFLKSLTPSAWLNGIVIDILEGQLITLSVVITFILVFLIREWVVQQQPAIDMGAAANRDGAGVPAEQVPPLQQLARQHAEQRVQQAQQDNVAVLRDEPVRPPQLPRGPRVFARPRARGNGQQAPNVPEMEETAQPLTQGSDPDSLGEDQIYDEATINESGSSTGLQDRVAESGSTSLRPSMPTRGETARATEIRRTLEEQSRASGEPNWPGVNVFMDLWQRAESNPSEVLRIIEQEGRTGELAWVVTAMKRLDETSKAVSDADLNLGDVDEATAERSSETSSNSWQVIKDELVNPRPDNLDVYGKDYAREIKRPLRPSGFWNDDTVATLDSGLRSQGPGAVRPDADASTNDDVVGADADRMLTGGADDHGSQSGYSLGDDIAPAPLVEEQHINASETPSTFREGPVEEISSNPFHSDSTDRDLPLVRQAASPAERLGESSPSRLPDNPHVEVEHVSQDDGPGDSSQTSRNILPATQDEPVRQTLIEKVMDWLWGEVVTALPQDPNIRDDEHIVRNIADEPPFVPVANGQPVVGDINPVANVDEAANNEIAVRFEDPEVAAAAAQAGLDVEAVEDGEDMEGIMELIGMQGPIGGLVQNGMFCAVLVSLTLALGIWVPYISGKVLLILLANPLTLLVKLPLSWTSNMADIFVDTSIYIAGYACFIVGTTIRFLCIRVGLLIPFFTTISQNMPLAMTAKSYADEALDRLLPSFNATGNKLFESDIPFFSIIAHESLRNIKMQATEIWKFMMDNLTFAIKSRSTEGVSFVQVFYLLGSTRFGIKPVGKAIVYVAGYCVETVVRGSTNLAHTLIETRPLHVSVDIPKRTAPLDYALAYWNTSDRITAILLGYGVFAVIGALYLQVRRLLRGNERGDKVEGTLADVLYQSGGVLKVILIISIEMIVFPLYCGLLLDVALLPLFGNANILSRIGFMLNSPNTSLFVHWFVGTCYMFHFALFVSMCRKILRSGVLYFIRDPDDPTFHPVRDVLERSVSSQLRKIAFSALVYGALVFVCLGGVVWGLSYTLTGVFPIHWSSNEPVLEFPVDLLFYNFLMPLAVKFFKPSQALTRLYGWWFRKCARTLRLTHFLFGERKSDEEGQRVYQTWGDSILGYLGAFKLLLKDNDNQDTVAAFRRDGVYVRAPASDQVRIPKGAPTFVEVSESDERADGQPDLDQGLHGRQNKMFSRVYIPPHFRFRIGAFVVLIWLFAATTGICMTVVPLVVGRKAFASIFPHHVRMNDVYAFSIGIYVLGGILFTFFKYHQIYDTFRNAFRPSASRTTTALFWSVLGQGLRLVRVIYVYSAFAILLPSLVALVMELYVVIPLHTYFGGIGERHVIHFVQDWTLGVLFVKLAGRFILWRETSRPANALRAIIRHGWLDPDVKIATRAFILPATLLMSFAILLPFPMGWAVNKTWFSETGETYQIAVHRYSYPAVLGSGMGMAFIYLVGQALRGWRQRIRDEVYLIGERLHNFSERRGVGRDLGKRIATRA